MERENGVAHMKFSKSFTVKGSIERVFELTEKYRWERMNFRIERSTRPTLLVLKRGSTLGSLFTFRVEYARTTLTISFSQKGEEVNVLCEYDVWGHGDYVVVDAIFTSIDIRSILESEVEKLQHFLVTCLTS